MPVLRVQKSTVVGGKARKPGDIVEASAGDAQLLIGLGKAELHSGKKPATRRNKAVATEEIETR
jgi:starvation-inducible outer membrane lipoprotein